MPARPTAARTPSRDFVPQTLPYSTLCPYPALPCLTSPYTPTLLYPALPHPTPLCPTLLYLALSYPNLPHPPYPTLLHLTLPSLPYPTLPYPTLPYPTLPYPTLSYPTLPYPTLPLIRSYSPSARGSASAARSSGWGPETPQRGKKGIEKEEAHAHEEKKNARRGRTVRKNKIRPEVRGKDEGKGILHRHQPGCQE